MVTDKVCLQKPLKTHFTLSNRNLCVPAFVQNRAAVSGLVWLDFGAKGPLVVFLLPCSLFAPSHHLTTPSEQTHMEMCLKI